MRLANVLTLMRFSGSFRNVAVAAEFHGLEMDTTMRALQALERAGKCAIMEGAVNDGLVSRFEFRASQGARHVRYSSSVPAF